MSTPESYPVFMRFLVSQGGKLAFEYYGQGKDEGWDRPLGHVVFGPDVLHDLRSVSKSVVALAYGIAFAEGKVPRRTRSFTRSSLSTPISRRSWPRQDHHPSRALDDARL
ncbi:hypothetical protein ACU4GH_22320 [Bradyrhizobium betae]